MIARRTLLTGAIAGSAALAGAGAAWWRRPTQADGKFDSLWTLRLARPAGGELVLAELRGKPLLINFWATWCAPCIRELPEIDRFHRDYAARGIAVIGLAIDGLVPVQEFLARVKVGYPVALAGLDGTDLVRQLGNPQGGLPFSVLIGAKGELLQRKLGETSYAELTQWVRSL
jgi:thiol-disulfide isomerase/thioredoxin